MQLQLEDGQIIHSTGKLDDYLYEIKNVQEFCDFLNKPKIKNEFEHRAHRFLNVLIKLFTNKNMMYKENHKYHVKGSNEPLDVYFKKSNTRLNKERKKLEAQFIQTPSYSQYVPAFHEDYVYSDANWSPSLASL